MNDRFSGFPGPSGLARFFSKGNSALLGIIADLINQKGRITFAEFMELALYHPEHGYYQSPRERIGSGGDFTTGPETHPVFGALLARQLEGMWRHLGRPAAFELVEMGAGSGALCRDIFTYSRAAFADFLSAIRYRIVETSGDAVRKQKALLKASGIRLGSIRWHSSLSQLPKRGVVGCFLSNELVDAFPVHRVFNDRGELKEIYVGLAGDQLVDVLGELSSPAIGDYFAWVGAKPPAGCQAEVNLSAVEWMRDVARKLRRGFVLTLDYGYPAVELYSRARPCGTLLCYYKHTHTENPYVRVGQQDITAHVDFTALAKEGEEEGLVPLSLSTQREFLVRLGLPPFVEALERLGLGAVEYRANRRAMDDLVQPDDLGRLKVLLQGKGVEAVLPPATPLDLADLRVPLIPNRLGSWPAT